MEKSSSKLISDSRQSSLTQKIYLIIPCDNYSNKVQLVLIGSNCKLPTLSSIKLLLEIVENFLVENKNITQEDYEMKFPAYFDFSTDYSPVSPRPKKEASNIEQLLDVENLQTKNIELLLMGNEAILSDVDDFQQLHVVLSRSKKYVTQNLRLSRKDYQKKIENLIKMTTKDLNTPSETENMDSLSTQMVDHRSLLHIMSASNIAVPLEKHNSLDVNLRPREVISEKTVKTNPMFSSIIPGENTNYKQYERQDDIHNRNNYYSKKNNYESNNVPHDVSCAFNFDNFKKIGEENKVEKPFKTNGTKLASFNRQENRDTNMNIDPSIPDIANESYPHIKQCIENPQSPVRDDLKYLKPEDFNKTINPHFIESFVVDQKFDSSKSLQKNNMVKYSTNINPQQHLAKNNQTSNFDESVMISPPKNYNAGGGGGILQSNRSNYSHVTNDNFNNVKASIGCEESQMVAPAKNYSAGGGGGILESNRPNPIYIEKNNFTMINLLKDSTTDNMLFDSVNIENNNNTKSNNLMFDSVNIENNTKTNNLMFDSVNIDFPKDTKANNFMFESSEEVASETKINFEPIHIDSTPFYDKSQDNMCNLFDSTEIIDNSKSNDNPTSRFQAAKFIHSQTQDNIKTDDFQIANLSRKNSA